jgi:hydroxyacylglutathione hydrolase
LLQGTNRTLANMEIETVVVGPFETNCFIAWNAQHEALVIDPGSDAELITAFLQRHRLAVRAYLLTHGHVDHVSALAAVHRSAPAPMAMHGDDAKWAFGEANQLPPFFAPPHSPDGEIVILGDGDRRTDGTFESVVLWTPGHTPGSVCFHFPNEGVLFAGDTLFAGSVGRTDLPGGDARALSRSLAKLAALPDETRVFAGHGPATTIREEKQSNFFLQRFR